MNKRSRVIGCCVGLLLLTGTMAASCSEDAAHDAPAAAHQAEIDLGHNQAETLNGSQLKTILNQANDASCRYGTTRRRWARR